MEFDDEPTDEEAERILMEDKHEELREPMVQMYRQLRQAGLPILLAVVMAANTLHAMYNMQHDPWLKRAEHFRNN